MESKRPEATGAVGRWTRPVALCLVMSAGCGGSSASGAAAAPVVLDPWTGPLQTLYDDSIHPMAVGLALEGQLPVEDPLLQSRTRTADLVARMRVTTVTVDAVGAKTTYTLNLQVGQPPLLPARLSEANIEITIRPGGLAHGIATSLQTRLRGRTFIGFVRRFAGEQGPELHWFLTADDPAVARVITETSMLDEMAAE